MSRVSQTSNQNGAVTARDSAVAVAPTAHTASAKAPAGRDVGGALWWLFPLGAFLVLSVGAGSSPFDGLVGEHNTWYITRAAGIMAYIFLWLAAVTGLLLSTRILGPVAPPPLLGAAHQWAAAWTFFATVVHIVILLYDPWVPFRWEDILLPFASAHRPGAVALGIYALYALTGVQLTSYLRSHLSPGVWRITHFLSIPAYVLALVHGVVIGTDTSALWVQALYWSTGTLFALLVVARLFMRPVVTR